MSDDPDPKKPGFGDLESPFLFVPHDAPDPVEWMRKHPGWVKFPATFVPRAPAAVRMIPGTNRPWPLDKRGQPWPRSRFGQPLRPLDEYPSGVRSPGEGYTGPIADPEKAMRGYMAEGGGLGKVDADPDAPVKAYLSAVEAWKNPAKYAGYPRPGALPVSARAPLQAERNADAIRAGMDRARAGHERPIRARAPGEIGGGSKPRAARGAACLNASGAFGRLFAGCGRSVHRWLRRFSGSRSRQRSGATETEKPARSRPSSPARPRPPDLARQISPARPRPTGHGRPWSSRPSAISRRQPE